MKFERKSIRSIMRGGEQEWRSSGGTFNEKVRRSESWFDRLGEHPVMQAAYIVIFVFAVAATIIGFFGIGGAK